MNTIHLALITTVLKVPSKDRISDLPRGNKILFPNKVSLGQVFDSYKS